MDQEAKEETSEEKPLSAELVSYRVAQEQELANALKSDSDNIAEQVRTQLYELLPECKLALQQILLAGDTDSSRLKAVQIVFSHTLGDPKSGTQEDDINKLIRSLTKEPSPSFIKGDA
jgi:hypothetical protein